MTIFDNSCPESQRFFRTFANGKNAILLFYDVSIFLSSESKKILKFESVKYEQHKQKKVTLKYK